MKEFLTFSDLELELLSNFGIEYSGNCFTNKKTGNQFIFKKASYGPIKSFVSDEKFQSYEFKGKDGTIVFVRSDRKLVSAIPSIIVNLNDVSFAIGEDYSNEAYRLIGNNASKGVNEIKNNLKTITFQYMNKDKKYGIKIIPDWKKNLSGTYFFFKLKSVLAIKREFSLLSRETSYENLKIEKTDCCTYQDLFEDTVSKLYDRQEDIDNIKKVASIFAKVDKATLYLPSVCSKDFEILFQHEASDSKFVHDMNLKQIEETYEKEIADINRRKDECEELATQYVVNHESKKK